VNRTEAGEDGKGLMVKLCDAAGAIWLLMTFAAPAAIAHGAVTMENDICKMQIGRMYMHFTGYQPQNSRAEFCQDIPEIGRAIIVLDMVDKELRDAPITFEVIRASASTPIRDFDTVQRKDIIVRLDRKTYPSGSIKADMIFSEPGSYVGMVKADLGTPVIAVFPFSVGQSNFWSSLAIFLATLIVAATGIFAWVRKRALAERQAAANSRGAIECAGI
jgi:hypothetical protein